MKTESFITITMTRNEAYLVNEGLEQLDLGSLDYENTVAIESLKDTLDEEVAN